MLALVALALKVNVMVLLLVAVMAFTDAICVPLTEMFVLLILTSPLVSIESVSDASLFAVICMASVPEFQLASSSASVILELIAVAASFSV